MAAGHSKRKIALALLASTVLATISILSFEHLALSHYNDSRALKQTTPMAKAICNFDLVEPYLLRGSKPTPYGMQWLKEHGVTTIVDLREQDTQPVVYEREVATAMGFGYINLSVRDFPSMAQLSEFTNIVAKARAGAGPVFVHCNHGSDRTGFFVFVWRIVGEKWRVSMALQEMLEHGFLVHKLWRDNRTSELSNPANW